MENHYQYHITKKKAGQGYRVERDQSHPVQSVIACFRYTKRFRFVIARSLMKTERAAVETALPACHGEEDQNLRDHSLGQRSMTTFFWV
jgi:hypothetical protein